MFSCFARVSHILEKKKKNLFSYNFIITFFFLSVCVNTHRVRVGLGNRTAVGKSRNPRSDDNNGTKIIMITVYPRVTHHRDPRDRFHLDCDIII